MKVEVGIGWEIWPSLLYKVTFNVYDRLGVTLSLTGPTQAFSLRSIIKENNTTETISSSLFWRF